MWKELVVAKFDAPEETEGTPG